MTPATPSAHASGISATKHTPLQFGVDLGGTKTEIIALDQQGNTLLRRRTATPADSYQKIVSNIAAMVRQAATEVNAEYTLGIGIPGAISPATGLVKNANTVCLIGQDLQGDLERALGHAVIIANDADCFALSEATDGAAAGLTSVFAVIIGTGCGGGWVINGGLVSGPNAISGEWGHNPLLWREEQDSEIACYCGQSGCIETLLSGPGLRQQAEKETGILQTAEAWYTQAQQGDSQAQQVMNNYHRRLAKALSGVINTLDPHAIVLGGGVSNIDSIYQQVPKIWGEFVFSDTVTTPLLKARYGDSSGVRGAAWLGAAVK
ncbi:ROK family protein [Bacterioplanoides sp.]|uniref:ROK family protein n=1 Tax=Bacterioplanoides sp. TaxID=2066072 RepID=UPI003B59DF49